MPKPSDPIPSFTLGLIEGESRHRLKQLVAPHVESFDYFLDYGLDEAVASIPPMEMDIDDDNYLVRMEVISAEVGYPTRFNQGEEVPITPREARESHSTYAGRMNCVVKVTVEGNLSTSFVIPVSLGELPVMVMSQRCQLRHLQPSKLVELKEEGSELGGYFILRGIERCIRLLQVQRRNYAMAIERSNYRNRGTNYSDKGVAMRCMRKDQSSVTNTLHYLTNGGATLRFVLRKQEFLLPVVLVAKALVNISDKELYDRIVQGDRGNTFLTTRLELLLRDFKTFELYTKSQCLTYLGRLFRGSLVNLSSRVSDEEAGVQLVQRYILVHVDSFADKLEVLIHLVRKLFSFVQGQTVADNTDALMNHELLLPGHLIGMYVKEKLEEGLLGARQLILKEFRANKTKFAAEVQTNKFFQKQLDRCLGGLGQKVSTFISTGNIVTSTGMDLMQVSGYTIIAERLNYFRYLSHFQSVHRGQFFTTMKTTTVRKLLPESWGFLCPVHTPDGGPCGLLNHLAKDCSVLSFPPAKKAPVTADGPVPQPKGENMEGLCSRKYIQNLLAYHGMLTAGANSGDGAVVLTKDHLPVLLDGVPLGGIAVDQAPQFLAVLRQLKRNSMHGSPDSKFFLEATTELAFIPPMNMLMPEAKNSALVGAYPGVYIFTQPGRFIRPVYNLQLQCVEFVGPMEQVFLNIACLPSDVSPQHFRPEDPRATTHIELSTNGMLSQIAALTPYSDYNQSPRNMYQCQMGKQTMGTPLHSFKAHTDNKLYRILNVQAPLVQTDLQRKYLMDEYPQGCNAVVAVISYTGYDMEDAMIINKASYERGFGYGYVYKTKLIDLDEEEKRLSTHTFKPHLRFSNVRVPGAEVVLSSPTKRGAEKTTSIVEAEHFCEDLDVDGLPPEGLQVHYGAPLVCFVDQDTGAHHMVNHKEAESAYVEAVRIIGSSTSSSGGRQELRKVSITLRYQRKPVIGDKFSSRHGQKGTLSVLWPQESMPFSESGMVPDVMINPHAFPSRMTIGMLIESMAGKSGAIHGTFQDATPFQFHEENRVIDHIGEQLRASGYSYFGSEPLYNGLTGQAMQADIFLGVVFYQRLR